MSQAYLRPSTLDAALHARGSHPDWVVLAGGTDAMLEPHTCDSTGVLDLFEIAELHAITIVDGTVIMGACTTDHELTTDPFAAEALPLLHAAASDVGGVQIRRRATIGGNLVTASPVGDLLPALLALDAIVVVADATTSRRIPAERFITGYRQVDLAATELLTVIEIPVPLPGTVQHWRKVGTRAAQAITKVSLAAVARLEEGRIVHARVAVGGVAERPVRLAEVETIMLDATPGPPLAEAVRRAVHRTVAPITDARSTAEYRSDVIASLAARFVLDTLTP